MRYSIEIYTKGVKFMKQDNCFDSIKSFVDAVSRRCGKIICYRFRGFSTREKKRLGYYDLDNNFNRKFFTD